MRPVRRRLFGLAIALATAATAPAAGTETVERNGRGDETRLVLFNNDLTNWRLFVGDRTPAETAPPEEVERALRSSVQFGVGLAGVTSQSLSITYSSFPFWKSGLYAPVDHDRFLRSLAFYGDGLIASPMLSFLQSGRDFIDVFRQETARGRQQAAFSFRVNDSHYTHYYDLFRQHTRNELLGTIAAKNPPFCELRRPSALPLVEAWAQTSFTGYFAGFSTGALGEDLDGRCEGGLCLSADDVRTGCRLGGCVLRLPHRGCPIVVLNFAAEPVRRFKLMQLREFASRYHPQAVELDLNRFPAYFPESVSAPERRRVMMSWLAEAAATLREAAPGVRIGLRVPNRIGHRASIGVDLPQVAQDRIADYAILAMSYFADQQLELDVDPATAGVKLFAEMTHMTGMAAPRADALKSPGLPAASARYRDVPVTSRQLVTAANQAYRLGLEGMALFNTAYYLAIGGGAPPLDVPRAAISCVARPRCAGSSDQEYALAFAHHGLRPAGNMLPLRFTAASRQRAFELRASRPDHGWGGRGLLSLSLQSDEGASAPPERPASVRINGDELAPTDEAWPQDPLDPPATQSHVARLWFLQKPFRSIYSVNADRLIDGLNRIEIEAPEGVGKLSLIDFRLYVPARPAADK